MNDGINTPPITASLPLVTGPDGQPYLGCDAVVSLLRAIADTCSKTVHDVDDAGAFADAVHLEADALDVRAIAHTQDREAL
ncbi:hypothetical protein [Streptomyces violascens]|uniref:hypothetical protein n=1 Tax=Streptomyces violascens TaxID=67381 RepID=UPI0036CCFDC4